MTRDETFPAFTAANRSAAMLHKLDAGSSESTRVGCIEPGCRSELICRTAHADNLTASWRCLDHRPDPSPPLPLGYRPSLGYDNNPPQKVET